MLGLDLGVALALALSIASAVLCVGYGLTRWNADGDASEEPPDVSPTPVGKGSPDSAELGGP